MLGKSRATALGVAIVTLLVACAPAAPAPTPTTAPKAVISTPAAKTEAAPTAKPAATPAAKTVATPAAKEAAKPSPLEQLVEGARKEGAVRAALTGDLGDKGAQRLIDAFNKKYNLNLKVDITLIPSMRTTASQVLTELRSGVDPSWDIIHGFPLLFNDMVRGGMLVSYDWVGTFPETPREAVQLDGVMVVMDSSVHIPAYNPNLVKAADLPRSWEDFLAPKWKGNLVHHNTSNIYARLVEKLGEEKMTAFVEAMARQEPVFAQAYQVVTKITSGEYPLTPHVLDAGVIQGQEQGAPVRPIDEVKPLSVGVYSLAVPKKAKYPNAALLFAGFQSTLEAQRIWWEEGKRGAPFGAGPKAQWIKGKDLLFNSLDFEMNQVSRLDDKFRKILGLQ